MGGSILGTEAIFNFLKHKIKKNFLFINNINNNSMNKKESKILNIIVSKSGNTLETISNSNILINNNDKNIFITENKNSYLINLANKLKADIVVIIILLEEDIRFYPKWHATCGTCGFKTRKIHNEII